MADAYLCMKKLEELTLFVRLQPHLTVFVSVFNLIFTPVTIVGNLLVLHGLWKASSIPGNLKKLFLNLALTDLAVGLFIQPMAAIILAVVLSMIKNGNREFENFCPYVISAYIYPTYLIAGASLLTAVAIAVDRLLALFLHLRYNQLVTEKRVGIGIMLLWFTIGLATTAFATLPSRNEMVAVAVKTAGLVFTSIAYIRIYKVVRYHRNRIHCQNQIQNSEVIKAVREKKSALSALYVFVILLVCYAPHLIARTFIAFRTFQIPSLVAYYACSVLIFFNSTLNPLIYCWRYREIRNIVKNTVKKIFCKGSTA